MQVIALTKPIDMETALEILRKHTGLSVTDLDAVRMQTKISYVEEAMKAYAQQVAEKIRQDCESNAYSALDDYQVSNKVVVHTCDAIMKTPITLE